MRQKAIVAALILGWAGMAGGAMKGLGSRPTGMMGGMAAQMTSVVGADLMAACQADLDELGLPEETRRSLEERRFELQKKVIRTVAELRILKLELARLLDERSFDLTAAQKYVGEIAVKESQVRAAHVEYLHALGEALTDEQWREIRRRAEPSMPGAMLRHRRMHGPDSSREAEEFFKDD
ncbi:MAG: hypothetical protein Kow0092_33990 [Deferrisomatales bacterium]